MISATNRSSVNGSGRAKPRIRLGGMTPVGASSFVAEAPQSVTNGFNLRFVSCVACSPHFMPTGCTSIRGLHSGLDNLCRSLVSLSLHNLHFLGVNHQLALHMIRSLVSDLTRNRPWVNGVI